MLKPPNAMPGSLKGDKQPKWLPHFCPDQDRGLGKPAEDSVSTCAPVALKGDLDEEPSFNLAQPQMF